MLAWPECEVVWRQAQGIWAEFMVAGAEAVEIGGEYVVTKKGTRIGDLPGWPDDVDAWGTRKPAPEAKSTDALESNPVTGETMLEPMLDVGNTLAVADTASFSAAKAAFTTWATADKISGERVTFPRPVWDDPALPFVKAAAEATTLEEMAMNGVLSMLFRVWRATRRKQSENSRDPQKFPHKQAQVRKNQHNSQARSAEHWIRYNPQTTTSWDQKSLI